MRSICIYTVEPLIKGTPNNIGHNTNNLSMKDTL